jgi:hypothetical protein
MALFHHPVARDAKPLTAAETTLTGQTAQEWAQVWFGVQRHAWESLALVPAGPRGSTLGAARAMLEVAQQYHLLAVRVLDASAARPAETAALIARMRDGAALGERAIVGLASPLTNPSSIPIARAATAAVLVVTLGATRTQDALATIAAVGREHFVGCIAVHGEGAP